MNNLNPLVPSWQYDEMVQVGKDFANREVVEGYDSRHQRFRDIEKENAATIVGINLQADHTIADFGCGTGAFVLQAARCSKKVHAIDISTAMLDYTRTKAQSLNLTNIEYHHGGFLTYRHNDPPLDAIVTSMALHHLPDFWKQKALHRLNGMLKPNGKLFLADVVFTEKDVEKNVNAMINNLAAKAGPEMAEDASRHVRKEYSTFTWIMEGLLSRSGFKIDHADYIDGVLAKYLCTKKADIE